jgi:hypothetical protein
MYYLSITASVRNLPVGWISYSAYLIINVIVPVLHHMWQLMMIGNQSVILRFLLWLVAVCIVHQMMCCTMRFLLVPFRLYCVILKPPCSILVLLILLCYSQQDIQYILVMFPSPNHSRTLPGYWPCFWFIPFFRFAGRGIFKMRYVLC